MTLTGGTACYCERRGGGTLNSVNLAGGGEIFRNDADSEKLQSNHQEFSGYPFLVFCSFSGFNLKY